MNVLLISVDSLRRDFLGAYSDQPAILDYEVDTENMDRFADRAAVFDSHYAGSLPCMPARREFLTGTKEFLWRPWGPVEPFDEPIAKLARDEGIISQFITDHFHYFQHGSHGYYEDFNGFEFIRGQEYDAWRTSPKEPDPDFVSQILNRNSDPPGSTQYLNRAAYARNSRDFSGEDDYFTPQVFSRACEWLQDADDWDEWFCYIDNFDVHEPFDIPDSYASMYTSEDPNSPQLPIWPYYGHIDKGQSELTERELEFVRSQFAGSVTMVDAWLGKVFDTLDEERLWDDTMVILTSDHGFELGDHGLMGKNEFLTYDTIARTPLMIWHPDAELPERVQALTTAVDLYSTMLDGLGISQPDRVHSRSLMGLLRRDQVDHRDYVLYGYWGSSVNVTDGQYTYHHPPDPESHTDCHSTSMINPHSWFTPPDGRTDVSAGEYLPYTETQVWRYSDRSWIQHEEPRLYDTHADPSQQDNIIDDRPAVADRMHELLKNGLSEMDSPESQYSRLNM
jgi:arylsulfatase A-like enzyme